jgi:hypothetical protein
MIHGGPIISGVQEERQDKRPQCEWPVKRKTDSGGTIEKPCGSEERVFNVKGNGQYTGRPRETPICERHLQDAWRTWHVDSATQL